MSIGSDRVVRYVVVATSSTGAMVALHEGIRCATGEYKVYARFNRDSGWSTASDSDWRSLFGQMPSRHPLLLARSGVCIDAAPNTSAERIVQHLSAPAAHRYEPQYR